MSDKAFNILSALALVIIIGVMSWRSMHPMQDTTAAIMTFYYAGAGITPAMLPDDNNPVTVDVGSFSYTNQGKTVWTPRGMAPVTIAQRQINLQFHFKGMPRNPSETIKQIASVVKSWVHKGDIVNVLIFDYTPILPNITAYTSLVDGVKALYKKEYRVNPYAIYYTANLLWLDGKQDGIFKKLRKGSFVFTVPAARISDTLFGKLSSFKHPFILRFPKGVGPADIDMPRLLKLANLKSATLTLDARKPLHIKKETVGLFPKF